MKILYAGEAWLGSCARSMKEALARNPMLEVDEISEDSFYPKARSRVLRITNRVLRPLVIHEFNSAVLHKIRHGKPDFFVSYKGSLVNSDLLRAISGLGVRTVNIYPDCSPHAHGNSHRIAVGEYDLVISTKAYHPGLWSSTYGYSNQCVFVPQGYDPKLHLVDQPPSDTEFDVVMIATCREEYARLMLNFAEELGNKRLAVAIGGNGWGAIRNRFPSNWHFLGELSGREYVRRLRSGKICIAPLTREVLINGQRQPGDVDTTRSYELAAAHCFFIHQRTDFVENLYGQAGVPMFEDGKELAQQVLKYIDEDDARAAIARAAHRTAVPHFSTDARAEVIVEILRDNLHTLR